MRAYCVILPGTSKILSDTYSTDYPTMKALTAKLGGVVTNMSWLYHNFGVDGRAGLKHVGLGIQTVIKSRAAHNLAISRLRTERKRLSEGAAP